MPYLKLAPPDWKALIGGSEEEAKWIADRDRKFSLISEKVDRFLVLANKLEERGLLFAPTPEILRQIPHAVDWYLSLAGFALNTLQYIREAPKNFGLSIRILTVRRNLIEENPVSDSDLSAFAEWLRSEIDDLFTDEKRHPWFARAVVMGVLGARAVGQGQNIGGEDGVVLLKRLLVSGMQARGNSVEIDLNDGFVDYRPEHKLPECSRIRFAGKLVCDFGAGGNRPDIEISRGGLVLAKGEIKARKDVSNIWESWMPQIVDHMRTWAQKTPDADRLFFGTLITHEMVEGVSPGGVVRSGLKNLCDNGLLTGAYNISKIAAGDRGAVRAFDDLLDRLTATVQS